MWKPRTTARQALRLCAAASSSLYHGLHKLMCTLTNSAIWKPMTAIQERSDQRRWCKSRCHSRGPTRYEETLDEVSSNVGFAAPGIPMEPVYSPRRILICLERRRRSGGWHQRQTSPPQPYILSSRQHWAGRMTALGIRVPSGRGWLPAANAGFLR